MRRPWGLPADLFTDWSLRELEACRQRVAVEAPHELRRHPEATRHVWLAAYAHLRGRAVTDTLVDLLIETVHHIGARAEHKVEQELLDDLKRVGGKQSLLLVQLAGLIDWARFAAAFGPLYAEPGRPGLPPRLMVGLPLLKHMK